MAFESNLNVELVTSNTGKNNISNNNTSNVINDASTTENNTNNNIDSSTNTTESVTNSNTNSNEQTERTSNNEVTQRKMQDIIEKGYYNERDYSNIGYVEIKYLEMRREIDRINEKTDALIESLNALIEGINKLAGLVEATQIDGSNIIRTLKGNAYRINEFANNQINKYEELNEEINDRIKQLAIELENAAIGNYGAVKVIVYDDNGNPVEKTHQQVLNTILNNKEKEERISDNGLLTDMIIGFEGSTTRVGDKYQIEGDPGNTSLLAVGNGLLLSSNAKVFAEHGIDISQCKYGDLLDAATVDAVRDDVINNARNDVINILNQNNITLEDYQIDALTSRKYNLGNINGFVDNYKKYGNTIDLYNNWMCKEVYGQNQQYFQALADRRLIEWNLFHNGIYPDE